ncbi:hypothetical protein T4E_9327 [Trichinella pseudospiralis]|uniref:Uncharacterized protein n=1 Tax=Trichinella pseudospiralis TaxID=6337 RepID=A0A0V0XT67_TRIPS|nr:hypothetical protein T4E_9327 [Trichinella pseudospiralis]
MTVGASDWSPPGLKRRLRRFAIAVCQGTKSGKFSF